MKIVIDIPKEVKEAFDKADDINFCFYDYNSTIGKAIRNGTPLPKGHGRLIDADVLKGELDTITEWNGDVHRYVTEKGIDYAPTIIEADKEQT